MTAKDILLAVIIPLALAEIGPWCGWLAARLLPLAAKLRYGDTERAAVRLEEWSGDLNEIPGQLTKFAYAIGQLAAGSAASLQRRSRTLQRRTILQSRTAEVVFRLMLAAAWRWRYEIVVVSSLSAALTAAVISFGALLTVIATVIVVIGIALAILYWPTARRLAVGLVWWIITPHRVRVGCAEALIYSSRGKMPAILLTSRQAFGERVRLWCFGGTSVDDFINGREILTAACWAQDVAIFSDARHTRIVTLDIIRRPACAISDNH